MTTTTKTTRKRVVAPQIEALPGMTPLGQPEPKAAAKPKATFDPKPVKGEPKLKTLRVKANGVTAPLADGVSGQLWSFFDGIVTKGGTATTADAKAFAAEAKLNATTATLALGYWRKFHGVAVAKAEPKAKVEPKPKAAKAGKVVPEAWVVEEPKDKPAPKAAEVAPKVAKPRTRKAAPTTEASA